MPDARPRRRGGRGGERARKAPVDDYVAHLVDALDGRRLDGLQGGGRLRQRCRVPHRADGASASSAPRSTCSTPAPDGTNINRECGSTDPTGLHEAVVASGAAAGLAFDGDADRVIAVDERGGIIDGDRCSPSAPSTCTTAALLRGDAVVATVMSNLGLRRCLAAHDIDFVEMPVGDRNVLDELERRNLALGGEQSGHIIFTDHAHAPATARSPACCSSTWCHGTGHSLSLLAGVMQRFPQVLRNVVGPRSCGARRERGVLGRGTGHRRRARRRRPRARAAVGHRAGGARDGRGAERSGRGARGRSAGRCRRAHLRLRRRRGARAEPLPRVDRPRETVGMCGIVGVVRRRSTREPPELGALLVELDGAVARVGEWSGDAESLLLAGGIRRAGRRRPARRSRRARAARGPRRRPGRSSTGPTSSRRCSPVPSIALDAGDVVVDAANAGDRERGAAATRRTPTWAVGEDRLRNARAIGELAGADGVGRGDRGVHVGAGGAVGARPPRGARARLRRASTSWCVITALDLDGPEVARRCSRRARRRPVRRRCGAPRRRHALVRLQGRGRDRRAGRQHRAPARARSATTSCCTSRSVGATARGGGARPHPLGQRRHHLRGQRAPAQPRGDRSRRRSLRRRRAERRRRQLRATSRCSEALVTPPEITTDAKVIPALVSRRARCRRGSRREAFRSTVAELEGSVAIGAQRRRRTRSCCSSPCAAAVRPSTSASPRTRSSSRASRTAWSRRPPPTCASTVRRRPTPTVRTRRAGRSSVLDAARAGTLDGHRAARLRRHAAAAHRRRCRSTPRSRRATSTAATFPHFLLKEISEAPDSFRKTLRGKIVESDAGRLRVVLGPDSAARSDIRHRLRDGTIERVVVIGQGTAAVAGQSLAAALEPLVAGRLIVEAMARHRALGLRAHRRHVRHARRRDQPERHDHRHEPDRRPRAGARCGR